MSKMNRYKTVIVVRTDIVMPPGKIAAQVAHAVMRTNLSFKNEILKLENYNYEEGNLPVCIVCGIKSEAKLLNLVKKVKNSGVPYSLQIDAGYNFVKENTPTVLCIGPAKEEKINTLTKRLQVYK